MTSYTTFHDISVDSDTQVHYAQAGDERNPALLLLHGFPSSSNQFRNLIPLLADRYHVVAPDLPGFGFTKVPSDFVYTFENLAGVLSKFIDAIRLEQKGFVMYIFDYGAPTGLRLALKRPELVKGIISQNGNAYEEGLTSFWDPLKEYWQTGDRLHPGSRNALRKMLSSFEAIKPQYYQGVPSDRLDRVDPHFPALDFHLNILPKIDIQIDLFYDYQNNVALYPQFQKYFKDSGVPVLAIWGKGDPCFGPDGAEAYKKDVKDVKVVLLDGGHFLLETHVQEVAGYVHGFMGRI